MRTSKFVPAILCLVSVFCGGQPLRDTHIGRQSDGSVLLPTLQRIAPVGELLNVSGRPVDAAFNPQSNVIFIKEAHSLIAVDTVTGHVIQSLTFPKGEGASRHGIVCSRRNHAVYVSSVTGNVLEAVSGADGTLHWGRVLNTRATASAPQSDAEGLALLPDERSLIVCLSITNEVCRVSLDSGEIVSRIQVGVAPYDVVLSTDEKQAWVSNWGGQLARGAAQTATSAGTPVLVDKRGVARSGTITQLALDEDGKLSAVREIPVGLHPTQLVLSSNGHSVNRLYCANANSDSVSVIDPQNGHVLQTAAILQEAGQRGKGTLPNALYLAGNEIWVALGGVNGVASYPIRNDGLLATVNTIVPTGWFPSAICATEDHTSVAIVSVKGLGPATPGKHNSASENSGLLQTIHIDENNRLEWTSKFQRLQPQNALSSAVERAMAGNNADLYPMGRPRSGTIKHIVYILKENRTYDQVFGDIGKGDSRPQPAMYGEDVTPNQHALANRYVLLDNYYCNGAISADGHSWAAEGNSTDHLEKSFGGFVRSYTFGDDPLTYSSTGFIWDSVLDHGLSFQNFGEMDYAEPAHKGTTYLQMLTQSRNGEIVETKHKIGIRRLSTLSANDYPGWNLSIPDQVRADVFLKHLHQMEVNQKDLPALTLIYLPNDHTSGRSPGAPTPRAQVADNDLALGRIVEGLSTSPYWKDMCIFVNEDDPQDGTDHVDGHRSLCLVIGPYVRQNSIVSAPSNQTSVLHTLQALLGLPAMNRIVAGSPLMTECFQSRVDLTSYHCLPARVPLDEINPKAASLMGNARRLARTSAMLDFTGPDRADEDKLSNVLEEDWKLRKLHTTKR